MLLFVLTLLFANTDTDTNEQQVVDYLFDKLDNRYIQARYPARLDESLELIPVLIDECSASPQIDPLLVAQLVYWESRWDPKAVGSARQEIGLMQLHGKAKGQFDLSIPANQLRAGVAWFRRALVACGNILGALNMYGSGKCKPVLRFAKVRYKKFQKQKDKYQKRQVSKQRWQYYRRLNQ